MLKLDAKDMLKNETLEWYELSNYQLTVAVKNIDHMKEILTEEAFNSLKPHIQKIIDDNFDYELKFLSWDVKKSGSWSRDNNHPMASKTCRAHDVNRIIHCWDNRHLRGVDKNGISLTTSSVRFHSYDWVITHSGSVVKVITDEETLPRFQPYFRV